jgi:hypothetical protein
MAIVWLIVWPNTRLAPPGSWRYIVLRWFHALVWFLLAVAAGLAALNPVSGAGLAPPFILLSLMVYIVFVLTLLSSKPVR